MSRILIVGSGLSAAAACAVLKESHDVVVMEQRSHLGGNCRDYFVNGTYVHQYGAHIYHNPNAELHEWLSQFTTWQPYRHAVTAEIAGGQQVPFPYSEATERALGRVLTDQEIVDTFFRGYSEKMWGRAWEGLPATIRNRVPKRQKESDFFPGQITGLPTRGYTRMMENMFDGCEVLLNCGPEEWQGYLPEFDRVIYCGRLDRVRAPNGLRFGAHAFENGGAWLDHVTLRFEWIVGGEAAPTGVLNYCHKGTPAIRRIQHAQITGGVSKIAHVEYPVHTNDRTDLTPIYPAPASERSSRVLAFLKGMLKQHYPSVVPLGRIASHIYMDMHQAVAMGRKTGLELL